MPGFSGVESGALQLMSHQTDAEFQWPPSFGRATWPVLAFGVAFSVWLVLSSAIFSWLFGDEYSFLVQSLWNVPSGLVQLGIVIAVLRHEGVSLGELGLSRRMLGPAIIAVAGLIVVLNATVPILASMAGNQVSFGIYALYRSAPYDLSASAVAVGAITSYVFVGPIEELAFRGYLQNKLIAVMEFGSLRFRTGIGIVATGLIFAALHVPVRILLDGLGVAELAGPLLLLALSGMVFGSIYALTQNLYLVMFLHGVGDFWPFVVDFGRGVWPNYAVLLLLYSVLVLLYRVGVARSDVPTHSLTSPN